MPYHTVQAGFRVVHAAMLLVRSRVRNSRTSWIRVVPVTFYEDVFPVLQKNSQTCLGGRMLHWRGMRILALIVVVIFSFLSVGCTSEGVMLQPAVQGEWQNFHNDKHQVSRDARESAEKPPAEK